MIDKDLMAILICPESHVPLTLANEQLIRRVNAAIAAGTVKSQNGRRVDRPLAGALVRQDGKRLYPIVDDIPVLLFDESISLE